jgi:hypothetical protein
MRLGAALIADGADGRLQVVEGGLIGEDVGVQLGIVVASWIGAINEHSDWQRLRRLASYTCFNQRLHYQRLGIVRARLTRA